MRGKNNNIIKRNYLSYRGRVASRDNTNMNIVKDLDGRLSYYLHNYAY
jgi:hypothetical protein